MKNLAIIGAMMICTAVICKYLEYYLLLVASKTHDLAEKLPQKIYQIHSGVGGGISWQNLSAEKLNYHVWLFWLGLILILIGVIQSKISSNKDKNQ